ncbi:formyltransferase family protein, partial [Candidatus Pelagibacter sp. HIMB1748]
FKHTVVKYDYEHKFYNKKHSFDYIFSFLSKKILKKKFLSYTKYHNINFHPGTPKYRGLGGYNFAIYNNETYYGCTAHEINEKIDNGSIYNVKKFKIKKYNVESLKNQTYLEMQKQFIELLQYIKKKKSVFPLKVKWSKKLYTKEEIDNLSEIKLRMKKNEIIRRIKATYNSKKFKPFLILKNIKFEYCEDN